MAIYKIQKQVSPLSFDSRQSTRQQIFHCLNNIPDKVKSPLWTQLGFK